MVYENLMNLQKNLDKFLKRAILIYLSIYLSIYKFLLPAVVTLPGLFAFTLITARAATGNVSNEAELRAAVANTGNGDVILSNNIGTLTTQLLIERNLILDLNGYTLTIDLPAATGASSNGLVIPAGGVTLTVMDSSSPSTGALTVSNGAANASSTGYGAAINTSAGTLIIQSGTVTATSYSEGAAIGGGAEQAGGNLTISGGKVIANASGSGAAIGGGAESATGRPGGCNHQRWYGYSRQQRFGRGNRR